MALHWVWSTPSISGVASGLVGRKMSITNTSRLFKGQALLRLSSSIIVGDRPQRNNYSRKSYHCTPTMANTLLSTLYSITTTKEEELAKQRDSCRAMKAELLSHLENEGSSHERVKLLLQGAGQRVERREPGMRRRRRHEIEQKVVSSQHRELLKLSGISPANLQRFLEQSACDASIASPVFDSWEKKLSKGLDAQQIKYEYATLFSSLVNERAAEGNRSDGPDSLRGPDSDSYESIGRPEMHQQRREWEAIVFEPNDIDEGSVTTALRTTFSSPESKVALNIMRREIESFGQTMRNNPPIDVDTLKICVRGLLASDLLSGDQVTVLRQMSENSTYLAEMVDIIQLRLASIEKWSWGSEPVMCEMRRQLNGKYRAYMQEEITQALLLYYIGINWAIAFKTYAQQFRSSSGWQDHSSVSARDSSLWKYYFGKFHEDHGLSIDESKRVGFCDEYFLSMLPSSMRSSNPGYGDDALDASPQNDRKNGFELKQSLLHLITAESVMADRLNEDMAVLQTDFRWFGPSISHSALIATLRFFGVDDKWTGFFRKFLAAPIAFVHDGPNGPVRTRKRGTPMNHLLSDYFGESLLFVLDFAVNQSTEGKPMYRLHDDIFFFGTSSECESAWLSLKKTASSLGIEINYDKTGTGRIIHSSRSEHSSIPASLPAGPLKWGFLKISGAGRWTIDQELVDTHIAEFGRQLAATQSVLSWIKAYNTYVRFFVGSFCAPANCLGRSHVDDCLRTLRRVHRELLPGTDGDAGAHVKRMIVERFGAMAPSSEGQVDGSDIPDGFVYFPWSLGGLELANPFITLQGMRGNVEEDPAELVDEALELEGAAYNGHREAFKKRGPLGGDSTALRDNHNRHLLPSPPPGANDEEFMSMEQYARFRRVSSTPMYRAWESLLSIAQAEEVESTGEMGRLLKYLPRNTGGGDGGGGEICSSWFSMNSYWKAVVELYGPEMGKIFGGLAVVEKELLPLGMLQLFKGKTRWQG